MCGTETLRVNLNSGVTASKFTFVNTYWIYFLQWFHYIYYFVRCRNILFCQSESDDSVDLIKSSDNAMLMKENRREEISLLEYWHSRSCFCHSNNDFKFLCRWHLMRTAIVVHNGKLATLTIFFWKQIVFEFVVFRHRNVNMSPANDLPDNLFKSFHIFFKVSYTNNP